MKATPSNIAKFQGQKVFALIFVNSGKKYLNIVSDLGINNSCSGGYGNGIITNFVPFKNKFKIRFNSLYKI